MFFFSLMSIWEKVDANHLEREATPGIKKSNWMVKCSVCHIQYEQWFFYTINEASW